MSDRRHTDCVIYVRDCPVGPAVRWISSLLDEIRLTVASPHVFCEGRFDGVDTTVVLTAGMEGGFLEIWAMHPPFPWRTSVDLARAAHAALRREARCDPGELRHSAPEDPSEWWLVSSAGEGLISWPERAGSCSPLPFLE